MSEAPDSQAAIAQLYYQSHGKLVANLASQINDLVLAEDLVQEAYLKALTFWERSEVPDYPHAWLARTAKHLYIDRYRREQNWQAKSPDLQLVFEDQAMEIQNMRAPDTLYDQRLQDDMLKLMFTCCHPSLSMEARVALCLRIVCGLPVEQIAAAFIVPEKTLGQRLWRAKSKIKTAGIPYQIPAESEWPERIDSVLSVIYLLFNEGYLSRSDQGGYRLALIHEAIRLANLMIKLCDSRHNSDAQSLLALMILQHARRDARFSQAGEMILLADQDRSLWRQDEINQGLNLLHHIFQKGEGVTRYGLLAAIAATHCQAMSAEDTDWAEIVKLYIHLMSIDSSPIVAMNHAIAVGERDGPEAGLKLLLALGENRLLNNYYLYHSAIAAYLKQIGAHAEAHASYQKALSLVSNETEKGFIEKQIVSLG